LLLGGLLRGEQIVQTPSTEVVLGWIYLAIFGAIVAFGAYIYLLRHTSPALATSYAYVNPVIAVMLGWAIANESVTPLKLSAGLLIVTAVVLISLGGSKESG
jgi:drug/metabolite transporter (DMT)-like permease